ncbi:hypothetical protein BMS3Bbin01_02740 [bacterium BMS3Bbin01]|nr:hypothetical protein BMS3Bbin01_02740 [bacterium BMS3Bbin01]
MVRTLASRQVVLAGVRRLGHQAVESFLADRSSGLRIDVGHPERRCERLSGIDRACRLVTEAGAGAHVRVAGGIDHDCRADTTQTGLGRDNEFDDPSAGHDDILDERVEEHCRTGADDEVLPYDFEMLGNIGDARPGAIRIRTFEDRPDPAQLGNDLVTDPTDDLDGPLPRRVEAVERVEHRRRVAPEERELLDEEGARAHRRAGDGRAGASDPGSDDHDVETSIFVDAHAWCRL